MNDATASDAEPTRGMRNLWNRVAETLAGLIGQREI